MVFCGRATLHKQASLHVQAYSLRAFQIGGGNHSIPFVGFQGHQTAWVYKWALLACVDRWAEPNVSRVQPAVG